MSVSLSVVAPTQPNRSVVLLPFAIPFRSLPICLLSGISFQ